jgi:transposase InsO family protein
MTRQNFYKLHRQRVREQVDTELVVALVCRERALQPRLGARKLLTLIAPELEKAEVSMGRDRLLAILRAHQLLILRTVRGARTTDSRHKFRVYTNLVGTLALTGPHQVLVSDITYLRTEEGFLYLCLVMDAYSRAIVGVDCSDSLESQGALRAVEQALGQLPAGHGAIHHSDRGSQYCCWGYVQRLEQAGVRISMTEQNHCYENGKAERLNGILKQEYGLGGTLVSKAEALAAVLQAVELYNHRRPHQSLAYQTPMSVHVAACPPAPPAAALALRAPFAAGGAERQGWES